MNPPVPDKKLVIKTGVSAVSKAYKTLVFLTRNSHARGIAPISEDKDTMYGDLFAERGAFDVISSSPLRTWMRNKHRFVEEDQWVIGEESMKQDGILPPNFAQLTHPVALVDALDGSRLWEHHLSNWCAAALFYIPSTANVLGSFICDAVGRVYLATEFGSGWTACRIPADWSSGHLSAIMEESTRKRLELHPIRLRPPRKRDINFDSLQMCFVGYKTKRFYEFAEKTRFKEAVLEKEDIRLFNLGGNPMLVRVADGTLDAVVELKGQFAHDFLPGLIIARAAGAVCLSLDDGSELSFEHQQIVDALQDPKARNNKLKYVVAANRQLAETIRGLLVNSPP